MAFLFGSGNRRPKKVEPDPYFKSDLQIRFISGKCDGCNNQEFVTVVISACKHKLCGRCLSKSTGTFENGQTIYVCPHCSKLEHSSWLEVDTLIKTFANISYCTTCFCEEAVYRAKCHHLLCSHCLEHIDHNTMLTCQIPGCAQLFSMKEIQDALHNALDILTWRYLQVCRYESCDTLRCSNKAILKVKKCKHSYCLACSQNAERALQLDENLHCSFRHCKTEVPRSVIQNFLQEFGKIPLMTAITLELSTRHCRKCGNNCSNTMRIRNRWCAFHHSYCIPCTEVFKLGFQAAERPYSKSDCTEDQIKCPETACTSQTLVKCLDAMVDTVKGKGVHYGIFVRKADFKNRCEGCRKKEAFIEFVACSHALCDECVNREVQQSTEGYYECRINSCRNIIPICVLLQFPISSIQNKNMEIKDTPTHNVYAVPNVSLMCTVNAREQYIQLNAVVESSSVVRLLKWRKDGKEICIHTYSSKFIENRKHPSMPSLKICDIEKNDEGLYRLIAENDHGQGMSDCVPFNISEDPPKIHISMQYDSQIKICTVSAEVDTKWPVLSAKWQKNQHNLSIPGNISKCMPKEKEYVLLIKNCRKDDEGLYRLIVETVAGSSYSKEINLKIVEDSPTINLEANLKKTEECLQLVANIFSKRNPIFIAWRKDGKDILFGSDKKMERKDMDNKIAILYVHDIGKEDEGEYAIALTTSTGGYVEKKFQFEFPEEPTVVTLIMEKYQTSVVLTATVETEWPIRNWTWKKDDVVLKDKNWKFQESKFSTRVRTLTITKPSEEDCGWYSCVAETKVGKGESEKIQLKEVSSEITLEMKVIKEERKLRIFARAQPGCRMKSVQWIHNGCKIDFNNQAKYIQTIMSNPTVFVLGVCDVDLTDEGGYSSVIETESGTTTTKRAFFQMSEDKANISLSMTQRDTEMVELTAGVDSSWPVDAVRWQRNGKDIVISAAGKYVVESLKTNIEKIKIKYPSQEDQGEYKLLVKTVAGVTESLSVFIQDFADPKVETHLKSVEMNIQHKSIVNVKNPSTAYFEKSKESALHEILRSYKAVVNCELCNKTATTVIQDCSHSFCLECLQFAAGSIAKSQLIIACPNSSCSSFINTDSFRKFINKHHTLHLEMPLHFQVSIGNCMGRGCFNKGFIKIVFCYHSLCKTCIQKCKSLSSCVGSSCSNRGMPPTRYFDYLLSALEEEEETPFLLRKTEPSKEPWTCLACGISEAVYEIIRCCHKFCKNCIGMSVLSMETPLAVAKCQSYDCNELYPVPKYLVNSPPDVTPSSCTQGPSDGEKLQPSSSPVSSTKGKWRGLQNIAFSCYRNCILQILAETPRFYECLEDMVKQESEPWIVRLKEILCRIRNQNTAGLEMSSILHQFHYEFNNSNAGYHEYQQEDSLSFLTTVFNGLDEEYEKSKIGVKHGKKNPVDIFRGQFEDRYVCRKCKKDEHFNRSDFLSLPLLKKPTLEASFIGLLEEEEIDMFPCTTCSSTDLQKELHICSFPDVLILQINKPSELDGARREKNIDFKESLKEIKNKELLEKIRYNDIKSYKLCGVVVHRGDERGGHYISYVKRRSQVGWEECDDSLISPTILKNVLKVDAYILLYEKCESEV